MPCPNAYNLSSKLYEKELIGVKELLLVLVTKIIS